MRYYLEHLYEVGPHAGTHSYVGPFNAKDQAEYHRKVAGPVKSEVVTAAERCNCADAEDIMSPGEHWEYVLKRL